MPPLQSASSSSNASLPNSRPDAESSRTGSAKKMLYWDNDPSQWDLTLYDQHYVQNHPSATKQAAHQTLHNEINAMKAACQSNNLVCTELERVERSLKQSRKDKVNAAFWKRVMPDVAMNSMQEAASKYTVSTSISRIVAVQIEERARELEAFASKKRTRNDEDSEINSSTASSGSYHRPRQRVRISKAAQKRHISRKLTLTEEDAKWIINGQNVSESLLSFRESSVNMFYENKTLPDFRELAIIDIFLLCRVSNQSISRCLGTEMHEKIIASLPKAPVVQLPAKATLWANEMLRMVTSDSSLPLKQLKKKSAQWIIDACNEDDDDNDTDLVMFADILHRSIPRLGDKVEEDLEDSFVHDTLSDLLDVIFGEDKTLHHHWANKKLPGTNAEVVIKPDFMVSRKPAQRTVYLFTVEVKPPANISSSTEVCEDRVKLGEEMKAMMRVLETLNVDSPETCGLLVQGYSCTVFKMDSVYKPVYRMMEMCSFKLVGQLQSLPSLPYAVECLLSCKAIVTRIADRVEQRYIAKAAKTN